MINVTVVRVVDDRDPAALDFMQLIAGQMKMRGYRFVVYAVWQPVPPKRRKEMLAIFTPEHHQRGIDAGDEYIDEKRLQGRQEGVGCHRFRGEVAIQQRYHASDRKSVV